VDPDDDTVFDWHNHISDNDSEEEPTHNVGENAEEEEPNDWENAQDDTRSQPDDTPFPPTGQDIEVHADAWDENQTHTEEGQMRDDTNEQDQAQHNVMDLRTQQEKYREQQARQHEVTSYYYNPEDSDEEYFDPFDRPDIDEEMQALIHEMQFHGDEGGGYR